MEVRVMSQEQIEEIESHNSAVEALLAQLGPLLEGLPSTVVLNTMANVVCHGVLSLAKDTQIGCIGWAYRAVDAHAEQIKAGLATAWEQVIHGKDPDADPLAGAAPAGNC